MAYHVECPNCDSELTLKRSPEPGKKITCPECEHRFVPEDEEEEEAPVKKKRVRDDSDQAVPVAPVKKKRRNDDFDDDEDDRPRRKLKRKQGSSLGLMIAGVSVLGLIVVAGAVVVIILVVNKKGSSSAASRSSSSKSSSESGSVESWTVDADLKERLGNTAKLIGSYTIDAPRDYQVSPPLPSAGGSKVEIRRDDPNQAKLYFYVETNQATAEYYLNKPNYDIEKYFETLSGFKDVKSKVDSGTLAGETFYRIRFHGTNPQTKNDMQGFLFFGVINKKDIVYLYSVGDLPMAGDGIRLLEAAVFTLKK